MKNKQLMTLIAIGIAVFLIAKFAGILQIAISCDETAYSGFTWGTDGSLVYSGIFGTGMKCGGDSNSPLSGSTFTGNHNFAAWSGETKFCWISPAEPLFGCIYAPKAVTDKYRTPEEYASASTCRVKGHTSYFINNDGYRFDFPTIFYDAKGTEVKWLGSQRGFRCIVPDDGGTQLAIKDYVISHNWLGWNGLDKNLGRTSRAFSGMAWLPQGGSVEFALNEPLDMEKFPRVDLPPPESISQKITPEQIQAIALIIILVIALIYIAFSWRH